MAPLVAREPHLSSRVGEQRTPADAYLFMLFSRVLYLEMIIYFIFNDNIVFFLIAVAESAWERWPPKRDQLVSETKEMHSGTDGGSWRDSMRK
jgi:hypothetical protein